MNQLLEKPKFYADIPMLMLMGALVIGAVASHFRFINEWYFIYPYGMILSMTIILFSLALALCSLIVLLRSAASGEEKPDVVSVLVNLFPLVYVGIILAYDN